MAGFTWSARRVAGVVGGVVIVGGVALAGGIASAQSPSPSPSPSVSPAPSGSPGSNRSGAPGLGRGRMGDFAARLAQALNIPQTRVEDALRQIGERVHDRAETQRTQHLAEAATKLGVTEQQLSDAIKAAKQSTGGMRPGPRQGNQASPSPGQRGPRPNMDAFFNAIAQQLGRGITGQQVQDALLAGRVNGGQRPDAHQIQARMDEFTQQLATELGVTPEQLRAALQSIGGPGFGGPGRRGR